MKSFVSSAGRTALSAFTAVARGVVRNGHDDRERHRQRYLCKTCKYRFDDLTGTVLAGHHQPVSTWILGSYFMGVNLVWAFQCQAVSYSSLQCVHPYVRSEEPSLVWGFQCQAVSNSSL